MSLTDIVGWEIDLYNHALFDERDLHYAVIARYFNELFSGYSSPRFRYTNKRKLMF